MAGRNDFIREVDRTALDATIVAGCEAARSKTAELETSFAIVRRAWLYGALEPGQVETVLTWSQSARMQVNDGDHVSDWTLEDLSLIRVTAEFITRDKKSPKSLQLRGQINDLRHLRSSTSPYIRSEAGLILAHIQLEKAMRLRSSTRLVNQIVGKISRIFRRNSEGHSALEIAGRVLDEILDEEVYSSATLSRWRVRHAKEWLNLGDITNALSALDPLNTAPNSPPRNAALFNDTAYEVELVAESVQKGLASTHNPDRREAFKRALTIAEAIQTSMLTQGEQIRLAKSLFVVSSTYPGTDRTSRADHLIYSLCPDPSDSSVTVALALAMHEHHRDRYFESKKIWHIQSAYAYIDAAFKKLPNDSLGKVQIARDWLVTTHLYTGVTSEATAVFPVLDYLDQFVPAQHPRRTDMIQLMAMALSRTHLSGTESTDRLVMYWEENLGLVRHSIKRQTGTTLGLAAALENTAIARCRRASESSECDLRDLDRAVMLSREAFDLVGFEGDLRTALAYSYMLNRQFQEKDSKSDRQEAVRIQSHALSQAKKQCQVGQNASSYSWLSALLDVTFPVPKEESSECSRAFKWLLETCLNDSTQNITTSLSLASRSGKEAMASGDWDSVYRLASSALGKVERTLVSVQDPYVALFYIQGMSSMGAVALTKLGKRAKAVEMLEQGATLRNRLQVEYLEAKPSVPNVDSLKIDPARAKKDRNTPPSNAPDHGTSTLTSASVAPVVYLVATDQTGLAFITTPHSCRSVWLPELTTDKVNRWLELTSESVPLPENSRGARVRGGRGEGCPSRTAIDQVITEAAPVITPLEAVLAANEYRALHVVPIGQTAGIPWTHTFTLPVLISPSANLLNLARSQPIPIGPRISISAPSPCTFNGHNYQDLEYARKEAEWLQTHLNFDSAATGPAATKAAFQHALSASPEVLHIAVHGHVDPHSWGDDSHLLWANASDSGNAETTTHRDLVSLKGLNVGTVFLAACWGGAPNRILPDESISFPTAFLASGVKSVIAPLWPVDDDAAYKLVTTFYDLWKFQGLPPEEALKQASAELRESRLHQKSSTWAAFMLIGDP